MGETDNEVALADDLVHLAVEERLTGFAAVAIHHFEGFEAIGSVRVVIDVGLGRDEVGERCGRRFPEGLGHEPPDDFLVLLGQVQVGDLCGTIDLVVSAGVRASPFVDDIPVFDDLAVAVRVEQIGGDPAGCTVVQLLCRLDEDEAAVDNGPDELDVTDRVVLDEGFEELDKPFNPVADTGRMLGVPVTGVGLDGTANIAIPDAFEIQALRIRQAGRRRRGNLDASVQHHRGGVHQRKKVLGGRCVHERCHRGVGVPGAVPAQRDRPLAGLVDGGHSRSGVEAGLQGKVLGLHLCVCGGEGLCGCIVVQSKGDRFNGCHGQNLRFVADPEQVRIGHRLV